MTNILETFHRLFDEKRYLECLPVIETIIDMGPHISTSWLNYGATLSALNRNSEAANAYLKASQLDPNRRGLFSACHSLAKANEAQRLLELFTAECEQDRSSIRLFLETDEFDPFFDLPEFQELVRKYGYQ